MPRKDGADESSFSVMVGQVYDGPLDLLLDLIRKQDIDIYDIPIAKITEQYLKYVETMKQFDVDVAAEFIYTASLLIHIKSKMLLPRDPDAPAARGRSAPGAGQSPARARALQDGRADADAEAADRRGGVVESGAEGISRCRGHRAGDGRRCGRPGENLPADSGPGAAASPSFNVDEETVTVSQMIEYVRRRLSLEDRPVRLKQLLRNMRSRSALVCAFLAILELIRLQAVLARQDNVFGEIVLKKHTGFDALMAENPPVQDDWR